MLALKLFECSLIGMMRMSKCQGCGREKFVLLNWYSLAALVDRNLVKVESVSSFHMT